MLADSFCLFSNWIFYFCFFFTVEFESFSHIIDMNSLSDTLFANIFSYILASNFILFTGSFSGQNLNCGESQFVN